MTKYSVRHLEQFGDQVPLRITVSLNELNQDLKVFDDKWSQYNPRKPHIARDGLCILNDSGRCGPGPALDSIPEYNRETGANLRETDFGKPTELYHHSSALQSMMKDMLPWSVRSHFLRLRPGGFFTPHRDHNLGEARTFRLIVPIQNYNPPYTRFMIEDRSLYWDGGRMYFVNTTKSHTLFNAGADQDSLWIVINAIVCDESIEYVSGRLLDR